MRSAARARAGRRRRDSGGRPGRARARRARPPHRRRPARGRRGRDGPRRRSLAALRDRTAWVHGRSAARRPRPRRTPRRPVLSSPTPLAGALAAAGVDARIVGGPGGASPRGRARRDDAGARRGHDRRGRLAWTSAWWSASARSSRTCRSSSWCRTAPRSAVPLGRSVHRARSFTGLVHEVLAVATSEGRRRADQPSAARPGETFRTCDAPADEFPPPRRSVRSRG